MADPPGGMQMAAWRGEIVIGGGGDISQGSRQQVSPRQTSIHYNLSHTLTVTYAIASPSPWQAHKRSRVPLDPEPGLPEGEGEIIE